MMRWLHPIPVILCVAVSAVTGAANAAVVLDFIGLDGVHFFGIGGVEFEGPLNYYAGGFSTFGSGPGPNYGISFSPGFYICAGKPASSCSVALIPTGNALVPGGGSSIMDVADGFESALGFAYSSEFGASVYVYSGLDATGSILATLDLPGNSSFGSLPACLGAFYCPYTAVEVAFLGTAHSVNFTPFTGDIAIADINVNLVPLPATLPLFATGLGLMGWFARRKKRRLLQSRVKGAMA